jgi:hypothetical protein
MRFYSRWRSRFHQSFHDLGALRLLDCSMRRDGGSNFQRLFIHQKTFQHTLVPVHQKLSTPRSNLGINGVKSEWKMGERARRNVGKTVDSIDFIETKNLQCSRPRTLGPKVPTRSGRKEDWMTAPSAGNTWTHMSGRRRDFYPLSHAGCPRSQACSRRIRADWSRYFSCPSTSPFDLTWTQQAKKKKTTPHLMSLLRPQEIRTMLLHKDRSTLNFLFED